MKVEKQLDEFYSMLDYKPVSSNAISLYAVILIIVKNAKWANDVKITNSILTSKCKLSISAMQRARNELITNEYIKYKKRKQSDRCTKIFNNRFRK